MVIAAARVCVVRVRELAAAMFLLLSPAIVAAQTGLSAIEPGPPRVDVSGSVGRIASSDWGDLVVIDTISAAGTVREQVLVRELAIDPATTFDAVVTYWEGRYGFRVHGGYAESCIAIGGRCGQVTAGGGRSTSADLAIWAIDVGGAVGFRSYRADTIVWPYGFVTLGGAAYDVERPLGTPLTLIEPRTGTVAPPFPASDRRDPDQLLIVVEELSLETTFAVTFGVGTDLRIPLGGGGIGLRLEAWDRIHSSPVDARIVELGGLFPQDVRLDFGWVNTFGASAGIVVHFGR